jgi:hypothetical protein
VGVWPFVFAVVLYRVAGIQTAVRIELPLNTSISKTCIVSTILGLLASLKHYFLWTDPTTREFVTRQALARGHEQPFVEHLHRRNVTAGRS